MSPPRVDIAAEVAQALAETTEAFSLATKRYADLLHAEPELVKLEDAAIQEACMPVGGTRAIQRFEAAIEVRPVLWAARERFRAMHAVLQLVEAKAKEGAK